MPSSKSKSRVQEIKNNSITGRTEKYQYILDYIQEAIEGRRGQNALVERSIKAYQGYPSRNTYVDTIRQLAKRVFKEDKDRAAALEYCIKAFDGKKNFTIHNGVETLVSMAMGGVGQYEFGPYDPSAKSDPKFYDKLAAAAKSMWDTEHMDEMIPQIIRAGVLRGASDIHIKPGKNGQKQVTLLTSDQMLKDPKRFKINRERFKGFTKRVSFKDYKKNVVKTKSGYMLKTLNEAQIYVQEIVNQLNGVQSPNQADSALHDTLSRDIDIFYKPILTSIQTRRQGASGVPGDPNYMYGGDEVEVAYIYDKLDDMYYEVVNRKYVTVAKPNDLKRTITTKYKDTKGQEKSHSKEVKLDDPFVELPYIITEWDTYPITPIFYLLDDFDALCAQETLLDHTLSIMAPITFQGQSSDAEKVAQLASVSGEIIEGVAATFGVLNKTHDITPIVTAISRNEEKIKRVMKAVDPFELQAMIGDRASAKEVASASGQVAQGINPFVANIESFAAKTGDKFMKMQVIFGDDTYGFDNKGKYDEATNEELAANCQIRAKLVTTIKMEQTQNARASIEIMGVLGANEAIDKKEFFGTMIPIAMSSLVTREQAQKMVLPAYRPMPEEVISRIKKSAEEDAKRSPIDKMDLSSYDDETLNQMMMDLAGAQPLPMDMTGTATPAPTNQAPLPAMPVDQAPIPIDPATGAPIDPSMGGVPGGVPLTPESGGQYANDPTLNLNNGVM